MVNVRSFTATNHFITLGLGALANIHAGACTFGGIIRARSTANFRPLLSFETSAPSQRRGMWKDDFDELVMSSSGIDRIAPLDATDIGIAEPTQLTSGSSASSPVITASVSPASNRLLTLAIIVSKTGAPGPGIADIAVSGLGLTWTLVDDGTTQGTIEYRARRRIYVFQAVGVVTPGTITITYSGAATLAEITYSLQEWEDADLELTPITNVSASAVGTGSTSLTPSLTGTSRAQDAIFVVFGVEQAGGPPTLEIGWVSLSSAETSEARHTIAAWDDHSGDTTPTVSWASSSNGAGGVAFRVNRVSSEWVIALYTKAAGTATPRAHVYSYRLGSWVHADAGGTLDDDGSTLSDIKIGRYQTDIDTFLGRCALMAGAESVIGNDAAIEAMGLETDIDNWLTVFGAGGLWPLNQSSTGTSVEDITGNGADQTGVSGTSVYDDPDLVFNFTVSGALNLNVDRHDQIKSFFAPSLANQSPDTLNVGIHTQTKQFFAPTLTNQTGQNLAVGRKESSLQFFAPTLTSDSTNLLIPFKASSLQIFQATLQQDGASVFDPTLEGTGSLADQMMAALITQGFTEGSLADREYERLLAKLGLANTGLFSIQDLYSMADEPNRLAGLVLEVA